MRKFYRLLGLTALVLSHTNLFAQSCFSTGVNGSVINLPCNVSCTTFHFQVPHLKSTSDYQLVTIPYAPYPFTSPSGNELTSLYADDVYSPVIPLPFPFCFYDSLYPSAVVGSNGILTFDVSNANCSNSYTVTSPIPGAGTGSQCSLSGAYNPRAALMIAYTDFDPRVPPSDASRKIEWRLEGSAPCRKLIVTYYKIGLYNAAACSLVSPNTLQIVIYESTGLIEYFIEKRACFSTTSNGGLGTMGIQNWDRTKALAAPGKNASLWGESQTAYRFIPSGPVSRFVKSELCDISGAVLATTGLTSGADTATTTPGLLDLNFPSQCIPAQSKQFIVKTYFASCSDPNTQMISSDTITVNKTASLMATNNVTAAACGPNGAITVNIPSGAGALPYSLTLDNGTPISINTQTYTFNGVSAGAHVVNIVTANGCNQTMNITVPTTGVLTVTPTVTPPTCSGASNASISLSPVNGVAPFTYNINNGAFGNSSTFSNLPAGTYYISTHDASGCVLNGQTVVVPAGAPLQATFTGNPTSCNGAANGSITIVPASGTAPFSYNINGSAYVPGTVISNLAVNTYFVSIQDAIGCTSGYQSVAVPAGTGLTATLAPTGTSCTGATNGSIAITPTSGSGPYQYSLNNGPYQNGTSITGLASGNYTVTIKDGAGCISNVMSTTVPQGSALTATAAFNATSCTGVSNGSITITPTNGAGPYTFALDGGSAQSTGVFNNIAAGSHSVVVTDGAGCTSAPVPVTVTTGPAITGSANGQITSCNGAADGSITAVPGTGTAPYTYAIDGGSYQGTATFGNLTSGAHQITIKDAAGCVTAPIAVMVAPGPALTATAATTSTSCSGVQNGTITLTPNATGPYTYTLNNGTPQTANIFAGLAANTYSIVVSNAAGCVSAPVSVTVAAGSTITGSANGQVTSCNGAADGSITAVPGTGAAPYTYAIDGGSYQGTATFANVTSGAHQVTIKDAAGCITAPIAVTVTPGPALTATAVTTSTSCGGAQNGTITLTPNATGPYTYSLNSGTPQTTNSFTGLAANTYSVVVSNAAGCISAPIPVTVAPGQPLTANVSPVNVLCNNGTTGSATIQPSANGVAPFQYSLNGTTYQSASSFTGLAAGPYTAYYRDNNGCSGTTAFTITEPAVLGLSAATVAVTCNGLSTGQINAAASGGSPGYQYSINGTSFQASPNFNVAAGNYTVTVKDINNCTNTFNAAVTQPAVLTASAVTAAATCAGGADGQINVTATGGTSPYQYGLSGANYQSSNVIADTAGTFTVTVKDANNCIYTLPAQTVALNNNLTFTPLADQTICEGSSAQLNFTSNGTVYNWTGGPVSTASINNPTVNPTTTTDYVVKATLGVCSTTDTVRINVNAAPIADAGPDGDICFGQNYTLQGSGGVQYQWTPTTSLTGTGSSPVSQPNSTITYSLNVTDANGCGSLTADQVTVQVTPPIQVLISKDTVVARGDQFQLHAVAPAPTFMWSPAFGLNRPDTSDPVVTVTDDIIYTVNVSTPAGCTGSASVHLKVYEGPEIYVPTAWTPNGDGRNDKLYPFPVGIKKLNYFKVFNRWGQMVFSTTTLMDGWDGRINGVQQSTGTFVWVVEGITKDDRVIRKTGTATLIR